MKILNAQSNVQSTDSATVIRGYNEITEKEKFCSNETFEKYHKLIFVAQGKARFVFDGQSFSLTENNTLFIPKNKKFKYIIHNNSNVYHITFNNFDRLFNALNLPTDKLLIFNTDSTTAPQLFMLYNKIISEISLKQIGYDILTASYLTESLIIISRQYLNQVAHNLNDPKFSEIRPALLHICNNYVEALSLNEYAKLCNMSVSSYAHKFKTITGLSTIQYLNQIRLSASTALLTDTNYSIDKISELVGFSSYAYFSELFKRKFNMSATTYRSQYQPNS